MKLLFRIFLFAVLSAILVAAQSAGRTLTPADVKPALPGQTQTGSEVLPLPQLSTAERIALQTCEKQKQDAQKQWDDAIHQEQAIMIEFTTTHPGYHLNGRTFAVERDQPKPALPVQK